MKVNLEEVSQLERRLKVEVPTESVIAAFDRIYKTIQRDVEVKGFRKGKAPIQTIKSLYRDRVKADVMNELIQEHYSKALDENALNPINFPKVQVSELNEDKPFSFSAEFEIRPEVKLSQYENLPVEIEKFELDPKHTDEVLENIKKSHATSQTVFEDRPAQEGDIVVINFSGSRDGQPIPNTDATDFELELGSGNFIPGFEDGLLGSKVGQERTLDLNFPAEYHAKDLAGTPITFKVKVTGLKKKTLPEINDELAKRVGFESVDKMMEALQDDYKKSEEKRIQEQFKNRLLKVLVQRNPVDVPKSMLQEQKNMIIDDVKNRMKQQGMGDEEFKSYVEKWDDDFNQSASFMIQSSFLVHAVAEKESLDAQEADYLKKLEEYAAQTGLEVAKLKSFYEDKDNKTRLMYRITEEKVVDFLKSKAKIREVAKGDLKD